MACNKLTRKEHTWLINFLKVGYCNSSSMTKIWQKMKTKWTFQMTVKDRIWIRGKCYLFFFLILQFYFFSVLDLNRTLFVLLKYDRVLVFSENCFYDGRFNETYFCLWKFWSFHLTHTSISECCTLKVNLFIKNVSTQFGTFVGILV